MLGISHPLLRHIRVAAIDNDLHVSILVKHEAHIRFLATNQPLGLLWRGDGLRDGEVLRLCQSMNGGLRLVIHLRSHHHRAHVLHVGGDGETEEQHQHHGHTEKYQHRPLVAQNVLRFFLYKCDKLLHKQTINFQLSTLVACRAK